jgi:uncharacterized cupin superfamily protein
MASVAQAGRYDLDRKPSFVDLRDFAQAKLGEVVDRTDYLTSRIALHENGEPGPVVLIALDAASGTVASLPNDEFVIVLAGSLNIAATSGEILLTQGDAAVLPHGSGFTWTSSAGTVAIGMRYLESAASNLPVTPISKAPAYEPSNKPSPDVLIGPEPECRNFNDYRVDDGRFVCGTWASTAYRRHGFAYHHYEIMHLVEGSVTLADAGREHTFRTGDVILAERGSHCAWDSREDVAKVFAIYRKG